MLGLDFFSGAHEIILDVSTLSHLLLEFAQLSDVDLGLAILIKKSPFRNQFEILLYLFWRLFQFMVLMVYNIRKTLH